VDRGAGQAPDETAVCGGYSDAYRGDEVDRLVQIPTTDRRCAGELIANHRSNRTTNQDD